MLAKRVGHRIMRAFGQAVAVGATDDVFKARAWSASPISSRGGTSCNLFAASGSRPCSNNPMKKLLRALRFPLCDAALVQEEGQLVMLFESFTHLKGRVILDDQLKPVSMALTDEPKK